MASYPDDTNDEDGATPHTETHRRSREPESTCLEDIIGHGSAKTRIIELILPLALPKNLIEAVFTGIRSVSTSIFLHGPPGCGKTQLARAIAGEAQAAFVPVAPSDILSKFVGDSEASVRRVFRRAVEEGLQVESKCAVVFFDEIDALGQSRENMGQGEGEGSSRRVLVELLLQLNTIADRKYCCMQDFEHAEVQSADTKYSEGDDQMMDEVLVIVVAATNRRDDCDAALLRRFGIVLEIGLPSMCDRKNMLLKHLSTISNSIDEDQFEFLAMKTDEWSGSGIEHLCREAAMAPVREQIRRAAKKRKRAEQLSGAASSEECNAADPDVSARKCLEQGLQQLRPVSVKDCTEAIGLITGSPVVYQPLWSEKQRLNEHYDSSSSDE